MPIQESGEMYIETIFILTKENDNVRSIDVCERMGYSKPSVSRAIGILKRNGYITVDSSGYISLTQNGIKVAERMYERHTILTKFLEKLGVPQDIAVSDACKMEHILSDESFDAMKKHLNNNK